VSGLLQANWQACSKRKRVRFLLMPAPQCNED
jgi:hypothetical protein